MPEEIQSAVENSVSGIPTPVPGAPPAQPVTPPVIDWSKVQVPDEVIRNHPAFKEVLTESIERRKQIAALKTAIDGTTPPDPAKPAAPANATEALTAEKVKDLMQAEFSRLETISKQNELLTKYNVPEADRELWRDANIETMAKRLQAAYGRPADGSSPGNGGDNTDRYAEMKARIRANIKGEAPTGPSLFSPQRQQALGGGIIKQG
jgi:hypothetical protein